MWTPRFKEIQKYENFKQWYWSKLNGIKKKKICTLRLCMYLKKQINWRSYITWKMGKNSVFHTYRLRYLENQSHWSNSDWDSDSEKYVLVSESEGHPNFVDLCNLFYLNEILGSVVARSWLQGCHLRGQIWATKSEWRTSNFSDSLFLFLKPDQTYRLTSSGFRPVIRNGE